jgi:hypothetical protein
MSEFNEEISELLNYTRALYKEVRRLNMKIRNERLNRILTKIPAKTILYDSKHYKNLDTINKEDNSSKIIINFND